MSISLAESNCTSIHEVLNLKLVNPVTSALTEPVQVSYELVDSILKVSFQVNSPVLHSKEIYSSQDYPFQYDVAEVFLTIEDTSAAHFSYYEFEVTPLGQVYDLRLDMVNGKRTSIDIEPVNTEARFSTTEWSVSFSIPLDCIGGSGGNSSDITKLRGNFFAIIGKEPRTYWSAFLPQQDKPNFHKPEFFQPLLNCK